MILFEGRDAAGKGGTIKRFMEHLNPRGAHVVALAKPSEVERGQWYFQRYIEHLPTAGEIVLFDRSWYNRAGVERVMGFCTPTEHLEFLRQAPMMERMLVNSGIRLFKLWFSVSRAEQARRFKERKSDPLKQWKLSPVDTASVDKWDDYTRAKEEMFFHTDTADAPWTVIKSDDKKLARINCMRFLLHALPYADKDEIRGGPPRSPHRRPRPQALRARREGVGTIPRDEAGGRAVVLLLDRPCGLCRIRDSRTSTRSSARCRSRPPFRPPRPESRTRSCWSPSWCSPGSWP